MGTKPARVQFPTPLPHKQPKKSHSKKLLQTENHITIIY
jgi:hypothetical protein